jgi:hypothetical protein
MLCNNNMVDKQMCDLGAKLLPFNLGIIYIYIYKQVLNSY